MENNPRVDRWFRSPYSLVRVMAWLDGAILVRVYRVDLTTGDVWTEAQFTMFDENVEEVGNLYLKLADSVRAEQLFGVN